MSGHDHDFDSNERDCANCGGEGFVYGCSWDWQCDTYDEGEGTCLCTRPCEWCHPPKPSPELRAVIAEAFALATDARRGACCNPVYACYADIRMEARV